MDTIKTSGGIVASDITIWTAGNKANPLFAEYPDIFTLDSKGRVMVDPYFRSQHPDVFVIGDAANTRYSGLAQTAIHNAQALGQNFIHMANNETLIAYSPKKPNYAVPIGGKWAILETETGLRSGAEGWKARREADLWVLNNFLVYNLAHKHWQYGDEFARF